MHTRPRYKGKLERTIPRDEAEAKGPVVLVERLVALAKHYGIDHQNQPLNDWLAALALALAAAHVAGCRVADENEAQEAEGEPQRGSAARARDKRTLKRREQDHAIWEAVEDFKRKGEPGYIRRTGEKRYSYRAAYKDFASFIKSARGRPTPEPLPEGLPIDKLLSGVGGSVKGKIRGACNRAIARREIEVKLRDTLITRRFYEMLGSDERDD